MCISVKSQLAEVECTSFSSSQALRVRRTQQVPGGRSFSWFRGPVFQSDYRRWRDKACEGLACIHVTIHCDVCLHLPHLHMHLPPPTSPALPPSLSACKSPPTCGGVNQMHRTCVWGTHKVRRSCGSRLQYDWPASGGGFTSARFRAHAPARANTNMRINLINLKNAFFLICITLT